MLDAILERLVEREEPLATIIAAGFPAEVVTRKNFGRDRRYPITNRFRDKGEKLPAADETLVSRGSKASIDAFEG